MDCVAELGNSALQPMNDPIFLALIEGGGAALLIHFTPLEQRVDDHQDLMRYCDDRFLLAPPGRQTPIERRQERLALLDRGPGCLDQCAAQILIPITNARALALACALVLRRRQPGPTADVP